MTSDTFYRINAWISELAHKEPRPTTHDYEPEPVTIERVIKRRRQPSN